MNTEEIKRFLGRKALEFVKPGMKVGLGTGSTTFFFIEALIESCQQGLSVEVAATSLASEEQAKKGGLKFIDPSHVSCLDLIVDGADEVDNQKRMIKGAGGALLREKILASLSHHRVVIVDETKLSSSLGNKKLPIEIYPFAYLGTIAQLNKSGLKGELRRSSHQALYTTDNGNYIYDVTLSHNSNSLELLELEIASIPGVVETGFFLHFSPTVLVGFRDGTIKII